MRSRLLPLALLLVAAAPRIASADDGAQIKKNAVAPIAGTPLPERVEPKKPMRARSPALVISGAVVTALGAGGALTGLVLMNTDSSGCVAGAGLCRTDAGRIALFAGAPVMAAGVVMLILGTQPSEEPLAASLRPAVGVGPGGATLTWRF
jgi:hypothetical protein